MEIASKSGREVVEDVRRVAPTGQQYQRPSGAAPFEHLESHVLADRDKSSRM
jgi:hypothetical protein